MTKMLELLQTKYPCRNEVINVIYQLIGNVEESFPANIYLWGHSGTGKTSIIKEFIRQSTRKKRLRTVHLNCVECYTTKLLLGNIIETFIESTNNETKCDTVNDFVSLLRLICPKRSNPGETPSFIIVLDNAERLRDMDANILPTFLRLQQLTGLNLCVVFVSQLPFEKYYSKTGITDIQIVHCPQYNKGETLCILSSDFDVTRRVIRAKLKQQSVEELTKKFYIIDTITQDFFNNYLNILLSVFYKACRNLPELKITSRKCFAIYIEPVLDGSIDMKDASRLWRHVTSPLIKALSQVYMRIDQTNSKIIDLEKETSVPEKSIRQLAQSLELPYYAKYLLIAAFLASHNSPKNDKRLFLKYHGKQRKRMQSVNAKAKVTEKMCTSLGPKSFTIDRLLAIFYSILEEKVGLTCNLLSQISTLVHLKLLAFVSGENNVMDGSSRLQCTISLELVLYIGKLVGFNVRQYLCDFM
ncbi:origin recognition complex subunit 5 [Teleopsis dalmanni]|uniref:origin recognition complex subunit 5 n=1 Tax=Teleopsis dalmanni TaxID=139649 RepID=UPI0018CEB156|nr:origin recognition complex subunit 5 [Teleopsis dalmanni]